MNHSSDKQHTPPQTIFGHRPSLAVYLKERSAFPFVEPNVISIEKTEETLQPFIVSSVTLSFDTDMSTLTHILETAENLFFRFGVKSVTMDDVANELGISKKTLYQFVPTKAELIDLIVENHIQAEVAMIEDQRAQAANAIDEMFAVSRMVGDTLRRMTPLLLFDLRKYYRQSWVKINQLHRDHIFQIIRTNLEKGQSEGLYRHDFDPGVIARLYVIKALAIIDEKHFPHDRYDKADLVANHLTYHLHGVLTEAGRQYLQTLSTCASGFSS